MAEKFIIIDNSDLIKNAKDEQIIAALKAVGAQAMSYASAKCPVDTGRLHNSIFFRAKGDNAGLYKYEDDDGNGYEYEYGAAGDDECVYIGTNVEYAAIVELGSSGRDEHPYLRPAVSGHKEEYKRIVEEILKGD